MTTKTNIKRFNKIYEYLHDPELRLKETNDTLLKVKGALFSGVNFQGQTWRNVEFTECDFAGGYEIRLDAMENCTFNACKIVGIHDFGVMNGVIFRRCLSGSKSIWGGQTGSKNVVFEACEFIGSSSDKNHQGGIGTHGEALFLNCKLKWFAVMGYTKLVLRDCECEEVRTSLNDDDEGSSVLIEKCKLRGVFDMVPSYLKSLTIRDTLIDQLDLNNATVKGDIVMERVRGGYINAYVTTANSLIVRDSYIYGDGRKIFEAFAGGIKTIEITNVTFGGSPTTEAVTIAGGTGLDLSNVRARVNASIVIKNSRIPFLSAHHINTSLLQLDTCSFDSLDVSSSRIDKLDLAGNTIARSVDFTNTQVKVSKVQPLAKGQAKLDGSNIKTN